MPPLIMRRFLCLLALPTLVSACAPSLDDAAPLQATEQAVVYGDDDRLDWYAHPDPAMRDLTEASIVALIRPGNLDESDPAAPRVMGRTLQEARDLCDDQRFLDHPAAANCSGTLIDEDLVITAGHCIDDLDDCRNYRFVFDYLYEAEGELRALTPDDVYTCEALLVRRNDGDLDYAIVQLDRPVVGHTPAPVRVGDDAVEVGAPMTVIGFGSGIPAKIDTGGAVTNPRADVRDWFGATLDTFGGNSGSGVFDADGELVGMLVRGEQDYVNRGRCTVVNELADDGSDGDEDVTYAWNAIDALCETGFATPLCTGRLGWCGVCETADDCRPGFGCAAAGPGVRRCGAECMTDADCRDDHTCGMEGLCTPGPARFCVDGSPTSGNACGDVYIAAPACPDGSRCEGGDCVEVGAGETCDAPIEIEAVDTVLTGSLEGTTNDEEGSCAGEGPERVYTFELTVPARVTALASGFDTTLYLREAVCDEPDAEVICNDDIRRGRDRRSQFDVDLGPGQYFLFMDAWNEDVGDYELELTFETGCDDACGPGATRCDGDAVEICEIGDDGCGTWVGFTICEEGEVCAGGRCLRRCSDTCSPAGSRICADEASYSVCTDEDGDGCVEWSEPRACGADAFCSRGGACIEREPDVGVDAGIDVGFDTGPDADPPPPDAGFDVGPPPIDVGEDVEPPPPIDVGVDAEPSDGGAADAGTTDADRSDVTPSPEPPRRPIEREGRPRRPSGCAAGGSGSAPMAVFGGMLLLGALRRRSA